MKWLFLVHQVQTPNSKERVKVWRLIKRTGAVLYRNSVYVLPFHKERMEDFQWACQQIRDSKGEASVFVSESHDTKENRLLRNLFDHARQEEYSSLQQTAERLLGRIKMAKNRTGLTGSLMKTFSKESKELLETLENTRRLDFFSKVPPRDIVRTVGQIAKYLTSSQVLNESIDVVRAYDRKDFQKKVWTTRQQIHIDRICSAWLIRRFIDAEAKFVFAPEFALPKNAIPFDVLGAEFSHHGEDCTFETLLRSFRVQDAALRTIAEIIHDIDLKDRKFSRPEAPGIDSVIRALSSSIEDDHKLVEVGSIILDALYRFYSKNPDKRR